MTQPTATATLAFDRASSRAFDGDGHLHVKQTAISKAAVNPYLGREIANYRELGLDENRVYRLLRDPAELEKAAASFNGKPLLYAHKPVSALAHDHLGTVGSISNVTWDPPYLRADLSCWDGKAIGTIQDGSQKELSSAYRYSADMTAGTYEGQAFDGVMRAIAGNHVALVPKGRAGADVVVGDSAAAVIEHLADAAQAATRFLGLHPKIDTPNSRAGLPSFNGDTKGSLTMAKTALTRAGAHTQGALSAYLIPKLAQDARIDLGPLVKGVTRENFKAGKPALALALQGAAKGKLAQDADLEDVPKLLDAIEEAVTDTLEEPAAPIKPDPTLARDATEEEVMTFLKAKLSDDDLAKVKAMLSGEAPKEPPAMDEGRFITKDEAKRQRDDAVKEARKGLLDKPAMDAAISDAVAAERGRQRDLHEAYRFVEPWVGKLPMAHDSAQDVIKTALEMRKVDVTGKHPDALRHILEAQPKPGDAPRVSERAARIAQDAAQPTESYEKMFPHADRLAS